MKLFALAVYLFSSVVSGISCLELEFDDYTTKISLFADEQDPFKGTITNESPEFGSCEGTYFLDLKNGRLGLNFKSERCQPQNIKIVINASNIFYLAHNRQTRVFYECEIPPFNPKEVILRICS